MNSGRKPLQGAGNIIRFNWPFFAAAAGGLAGLLTAWWVLPPGLAGWAGIGFGVGLLLLTGPLVAAMWVYDCSGLYRMPWLDGLAVYGDAAIVNIHSGFDETSGLLRQRFPTARHTTLDFYDPVHHTEASIRRARAVHPPGSETVKTTTSALPLPTASADLILLTFAAHEIRDDAERVVFFREAARLLARGGRIVVTEHLRDFPNFLAWHAGVLHFHSRRIWETTFEAAGLTIAGEAKHTPLVTTFFLQLKQP